MIRLQAMSNVDGREGWLLIIDNVSLDIMNQMGGDPTRDQIMFTLPPLNLKGCSGILITHELVEVF